jgi:hypothetical protein
MIYLDIIQMEIGRNLLLTRDGDELVLTIDLTVSLGPSSSGVTELIATTGGNKPLGQTGAVLGFNFYVKAGSGPLKATPTEKPEDCGLNTTYSVSADGKTMEVRLAITKTGRLSSSGKSTLLASSSARAVAGTSATLNVNCFATNPEMVDINKVTEAADFTFEVAEKPYVVMSAELKGASGKITRRLTPIAGSADGLKAAATLEWSKFSPAAPAVSFVAVPGASNLEYRWVSGTKLQLRFDGSARGGTEGCAPSQLLVAGTAKDKNAASAALSPQGATVNLTVAVLRARPSAEDDTQEDLKRVLREAVEAFIRSSSEEALRSTSVKAVKAHVAPLVTAEAAKRGVKVDLSSEVMRLHLRECVVAALGEKGTVKRERDGDGLKRESSE